MNLGLSAIALNTPELTGGNPRLRLIMSYHSLIYLVVLSLSYL